MKLIESIFREIADRESLRVYKFKIGKLMATSLSGFLAGMIVASVIWFAVYYVGYMPI